MKRLIRFVVLLAGAVLILSDVPGNRAELSASGGCICSGEAYLYLGDHIPENFVGWYAADKNIGVAGSQWQCADMCQVWINVNVGGFLCAYYGVGNEGPGEGGVDEDWRWYYAGADPWPHGTLNQEYDCWHLYFY